MWKLFDDVRNELKAAEHYRRHLLVRAVAAWHSYIVMVQRERDMEQARQKTQNKMAAFLNAAASGQLWTDGTCKTASEAVTKTETPSANGEIISDEPAVWFVAYQYQYVKILNITCHMHLIIYTVSTKKLHP